MRGTGRYSAIIAGTAAGGGWTERALATVKERIAGIPEGSAALFFIQIFATLGFAVLYSTLVLYATRHLGFPAKEAAAIMGVFGAFNYGLHLFGGYLGGRFLSNRNLFVGGMLLQVSGCALISLGTTASMYWGLALFLTGSGLNVTCINMMLTQRFAPEDDRRESAFLWNYAGMNVGFFIGFAVAGHYQLTESYSNLFLFATVGNFLAIVLATINWKRLKDLNTPLLRATTEDYRRRFAIGVAILLGVPVVVWVMLQHTGSTESMLKFASAGVLAVLVYLTLKHPDAREKNNMWAYLILGMGSLVFWSLYQMAPNGLQLFAVQQRRPARLGRRDRAAVGAEHQHGGHRRGRPAAGCAVLEAAIEGLEDRHPAAVRGVADPDGPRFPGAAGRHRAGERSGPLRVLLAVPELRAASDR